MSSPNDTSLAVRSARAGDLAAIRAIYNEGIADRGATLDLDPKTEAEIVDWFAARSDGHYAVVVATREDAIVGWASLNPYSHRCAYANVADLSIYVARAARGTGAFGRRPEFVEGERPGQTGFVDDDELVLAELPAGDRKSVV